MKLISCYSDFYLYNHLPLYTVPLFLNDVKMFVTAM